MTRDSMTVQKWIRKGLSEHGEDLVREMLQMMAQLLMSADVDGLPKSKASEMAQSLDETVEAFRTRPLDAGPYPFLWLDAMEVKSRDAGRVVNVTLVQAIAVNAGGHREILGLDVVTSEDGAAWLGILSGLGRNRRG